MSTSASAAKRLRRDARNRARATIVLLLAAALPAQAAEPRFSGKAGLSPPEPVSADRRFELHAELSAGDTAQVAGRFQLDAKLGVGASAKAALATTACGPPDNDIFADSYEGTSP